MKASWLERRDRWAGGEAGRPSAASLALVAILTLWFAWALPLALGERTLVLRDVLRTHVPYKAFGAMTLAKGSIPAINPTWSMGQPFAGNPSTLAFYPGNVLYLLLPFWSAFNLHFALHWLIGFLGMRALARALDQSPVAALLAALVWASSGYFISLLTYYNVVGVGAWAPWIMCGLVRGGRRGVAGAGLATGLALLAGEPFTAALLVPAMVVAAWERRSLLAALKSVGLAGVLGLAIACVQLVATFRVLGFSSRFSLGVTADIAASQAISLWRFLELLVPLPWGWPSDLAHFEFWAPKATPIVPHIYSMHVGVVAGVLAVTVAATRRRWAVLALLGLFLAWGGGLSGEATRAATFGVFRFPQKALILFTLAAAVLSGWGLDRYLREDRRSVKPMVLSGALLLGLAGVLWSSLPWFTGQLQALATSGSRHFVGRAAAIWIFGFVLAGAGLLAAGWALARRAGTWVLVIHLAGISALAPAMLTDATAHYRGLPPLGSPIEADHGGRTTSIVPVPYYTVAWEALPPRRIATLNVIEALRLGYQGLDPVAGVTRGWRYPFLPELEGLTSPLQLFVFNNLAQSPWPARVEWMRRYGAEWVVRLSPAPVDGLAQTADFESRGLDFVLDRVRDAEPVVRWPERVLLAKSPLEAYRMISRGEAGRAAVSSRETAHHPGARVKLLKDEPDRVEASISGGGGLLVVQRSWLPLYRARLAGGTPLRTQPVDVALLGVEVPAGDHRIVIDVARGPEIAAAILGLATLLALLFVLLRREKHSASHSTAFGGTVSA